MAIQLSGSLEISGSIVATGGITMSGSIASASYAGNAGLLSGRDVNSFATTGSNQYSGSQTITGSLTVTGQVIAQTLNVQQVTSSIVYSSGSNVFGNSISNTQQFTGSVGITGSLTVNGPLSGTSATLSSTLSGTSAIFSSSVTATSFIRSGGTSSQFLMADGSVNTNVLSSGAYLPLTGGTLTGQLNGTILSMSGDGSFGGRVQSTGYSTLPTTGSLLSMGFTGGVGYLQSWASNALAPISIDGSTFAVRVNGFATTAISVNGSGATTLGGALSGTSASFSTASTGRVLTLDVNVTNRARLGFDVYENYAQIQAFGFGSSLGALALNPVGNRVLVATTTDNGTDALQVNGSGRFASSVGIASAVENLVRFVVAAPGTTSAEYIMIGRNSSGNFRYGLDATGAATFASSVTAGGQISSLTSNAVVAAVSTVAANDAVVSARWTSGVGMEIKYNPNSAIGYIDNTYPVSINENFGDIHFRVNVSSTQTTRMLIKGYSGKVLIGTTTPGYGLFSEQRVTINPSQDGIVVAPLGENFSAYTVQALSDTGTRYALYIANGSSTQVGSISFTSSSTSYNTSSDYRLKEDLRQVNGLEKVSAIKVYDFKWKSDQSRMHGVLAHELQEVLPYAVTGVKDGDQMQAVDYSKIVPVLVKAIQELKQQNDALVIRIEQLETK